MPPLLPRSILRSPTSRLLPSNRICSQSFSTHPLHRLGHPDGDAFYDPPTGWLFGVPPGEKYKKEGWENIWVYGYWGSCLLAVVAYIYKPDTSWVALLEWFWKISAFILRGLQMTTPAKRKRRTQADTWTWQYYNVYQIN